MERIIRRGDLIVAPFPDLAGNVARSDVSYSGNGSIARGTMAVPAMAVLDERKRDGGIPTFGEMADDVRETLSVGFRNEKHKAQWKSTLETYAAPLRARPVDTSRDSVAH